MSLPPLPPAYHPPEITTAPAPTPTSAAPTGTRNYDFAPIMIKAISADMSAGITDSAVIWADCYRALIAAGWTITKGT
jgi:hypothetical protein